MQSFKEEFLDFAIQQQVLLFGEFKTKAGRMSPYFFNAGLFDDGVSLKKLGEFYASAIDASGLAFDALFGPAYKGIPLAASVAIAYAAGVSTGARNIPFSYNRKEAKDHGEGGSIVGAKLSGRVLIVDDVISAGTSVRESVELIRAAGATPCGVAIALDRMERGQGDLSAVQEVSRDYGIPVIGIVNLDDLARHLDGKPDWRDTLASIQAYRGRYGVRV
ncbi:MAG: orotate phosphoribosyltransferase [Hydrogenophilales bacterium 28-61-23]|nr:MAG: orotate phosphoribosyltransferase [Hydrogenophilales bacterium 28-61-23]